jgi:hypothetical protein
MCLSPGGGARRWLGALAVAVCVAVFGCGGVGKGTITGKVTYKGQTLKGGRVTYSVKGKSVLAEIGEDGTYTAADVPTGEAKVTVQTSYLQQMARAPKYKVPEGAPEGYKAGGDPSAAKRYVAIPPNYEDLELTNLTYNVKSGNQTNDIDLK